MIRYQTEGHRYRQAPSAMHMRLRLIRNVGREKAMRPSTLVMISSRQKSASILPLHRTQSRSKASGSKTFHIGRLSKGRPANTGADIEQQIAAEKQRRHARIGDLASSGAEKTPQFVQRAFEKLIHHQAVAQRTAAIRGRLLPTAWGSMARSRHRWRPSTRTSTVNFLGDR